MLRLWHVIAAGETEILEQVQFKMAATRAYYFVELFQ